MKGLRATTTVVAAIVLSAAFAAPRSAGAHGAEPSTSPTVLTASCTSSVGPGIPPPTSVPSGLPGFHASWYGQSGYMTLCAGESMTATVAMYNSGSRGWVNGVMGQAAYLGTWDPTPGQDQPSTFGGDGTNGSPNTSWPRYNRVAVQPATYVGPNQIAWFQFAVRAPATAGSYRFYIRPLIEGAQWMEDFGIYWQITVPAAADATQYTNSTWAYALTLPSPYRHSDLLSFKSPPPDPGQPKGSDVFTARTVDDEAANSSPCESGCPAWSYVAVVEVSTDAGSMTPRQWYDSGRVGFNSGEQVENTTVSGRPALKITNGARYVVEYIVAKDGRMYVIGYRPRIFDRYPPPAGASNEKVDAILASFTFL